MGNGFLVSIVIEFAAYPVVRFRWFPDDSQFSNPRIINRLWLFDHGFVCSFVAYRVNLLGFLGQL